MRGTPVRSRSGEELGAIDDFVFDRQLRYVERAVVVHRGLLTGNKSFDLPLTSLTLDTENECFIVTSGEEPPPSR
jgi:uncharacterized protein YrrD